jgi:hypothetical protein
MKIKYKYMEGDSSSNKQESLRDSLPNDSDISEPPRIRYTSLQTDRINKKLLAYNVRSLWLCVPIVYIIFYFI